MIRRLVLVLLVSGCSPGNTIQIDELKLVTEGLATVEFDATLLGFEVGTFPLEGVYGTQFWGVTGQIESDVAVITSSGVQRTLETKAANAWLVEDENSIDWILAEATLVLHSADFSADVPNLVERYQISCEVDPESEPSQNLPEEEAWYATCLFHETELSMMVWELEWTVP